MTFYDIEIICSVLWNLNRCSLNQLRADNFNLFAGSSLCLMRISTFLLNSLVIFIALFITQFKVRNHWGIQRVARGRAPLKFSKISIRPCHSGPVPLHFYTIRNSLFVFIVNEDLHKYEVTGLSKSSQIVFIKLKPSR